MPSTMPRPLNADARTNSPSMSCAALHPGSPAASGASPTCSKHCSPSRNSGVPQQLIGGDAADLRIPAPGQSAKVAMLGLPGWAHRDLIVHTSRTKRSSDFIALLEEIDRRYGPKL